MRVDGLTVEIETKRDPLRIVEDVSFSVYPGETLGIVGESGSGKSMTALSVMGLLPERGRIAAGSVQLQGSELTGLDSAHLRSLRGRRVAMIFQDPLTSLNPVLTIGRQLTEAIRLHDRSVTRAAARDRSARLLSTVGLADPNRVLDSHPHQLSGGMRQRAMIVMAMSNQPDLIIADEPTTALDVTTQAQVLDCLAMARQEVGSALLLISHDLGLVGERCDRVHVMYNGRIVESGDTAGVLERPTHPYTVGLLASRPTLDRRRRLAPVPGSPPTAFDVITGCAFAPRCGRSAGRDRCVTTRPELIATPGHAGMAACHFPGDPGDPPQSATSRDDASSPKPARAAGDGFLVVDRLTKEFGHRRRLGSRRRSALRAVDDVSFSLAAGRTLALVGESGSGKSTIARAVLRLLEPTTGAVSFDGDDVLAYNPRALRHFRTRAQLVQQDPYSALNPRMTVGEAIAEPIRVHGEITGSEVQARVNELLRSVGLRPEHGRRFPHEFSGGERQRICIARALSVQPQVLVLDEPVSSLDVSIQAQILNLLYDIQVERQLAYLFITHDLAVVRNIADEIMVLHRGSVVESGPADSVLSDPASDYTRSLIAAVADPARRRVRQEQAEKG